MKILKDYRDTSLLLDEVLSFADQHRNEFGFLAKSAYEELAMKGQLWVAQEEDGVEIAGYLIFGGVYPALKVFQLFVNPSYQKRGVGKNLIVELVKYGEDNNFNSVNARVAADLEANHFWEKQGFKLASQVPGGKTTSRIINIRSLQLNTQDLLSNLDDIRETKLSFSDKPLLSTPAYALDLNPVFDITKRRKGYEESLHILSHAMTGQFTLCITPEFKVELERTSNNPKNDPFLELAHSLPVLPACHPEKINKLVDELREVVFPGRSRSGKSSKNDQSDLTHIAYCIVNRVNGLITREKRLLENSLLLKNNYGVSIISPDEILNSGDTDWEIQVDSETSPGTIKVTSLHDGNVDDAISFLKTRGFSTTEATGLVTQVPGSKVIKKVVIQCDEVVIGYSCWNIPSGFNKHIDLCMYVNEEIQGVLPIIDHVFETINREIPIATLCRVDLRANSDQSLTFSTAVKRGFVKNIQRNVWSKVVYNGFVNEGKWHAFRSEFSELTGLSLPSEIPPLKVMKNTGIPLKFDGDVFQKCLSLFDFETLISPGFILPKGRDCLLLPIKEDYAKGLLGSLTSQMELLPASKVTLLLEKAYFRSPRGDDAFEPGKLISFYVSGTDSVQQIVALGRITYSGVINVEEAILKFGRQGVLSRGELTANARSSDNHIHVFTFDNFKIFPKRMSFKRAKELGIIGGANLVTYQNVEFAKFSIMLDEVYKHE